MHLYMPSDKCSVVYMWMGYAEYCEDIALPVSLPIIMGQEGPGFPYINRSTKTLMCSWRILIFHPWTGF